MISNFSKFVFFLLMVCSISAFSQTLVIQDNSDKLPLEYVNVICEKLDFVSYTDSKGRIDISSLKGADSIIIHFVGYKDICLSFDSLASGAFKIGLEAEHLAMEEVVITASRWQENSEDATLKVTSITPRKIEMQNPQTSADVIGLSGEVFIQKSQMGGGSPMIRGFAANRVLLAVDGVRMNNAIFRSGNLQNIISIDPFSISQAEVIFGPGSTLFGSDAIGGVMNFHTIKPIFSNDTSLYTDANTILRFSSASNEYTPHLDFAIGGRKLASVTSISYSNFGDLKMGKNGPDSYLREDFVESSFSGDTIIKNEDPLIQKGSGYRQINLLQKLSYKLNSYTDITLGINYSNTSDIPRYDRLSQRDNNDALSFASWSYGPQRWMMNSLTANFDKKTSVYDNMKVILAYQYFEESRESRRLFNSIGNSNQENVDAYSANIDFRKRMNPIMEFFYGGEFIYNSISSSASQFSIVPGDTTSDLNGNSTRYPNGSNWSSAGIYLSAKSELTENLSMQTGIRYNQIILNADFDSSVYLVPIQNISLSTSALTGSLGFNYKPEKDLIFTLNFSTGFRAPNIDDIAKVFDSEPGAVVIPNPDLNSEYAYSADIGMKKAIDKALFFKANAFYTLLDNAMVRRNFTINGQDTLVYQGEPSRVQAIQNAASATVYGFQMGMDINFTSFITLELKYNWQKGEEELDDGTISTLRHVSPQFGSLQLSYKKSRFEAIAYLIYNGEISHNNLAITERDKPQLYAKDQLGRPYSPSWYTANLKLGYRINERLSCRFGVENITDQRYRPYSSGIAAAGRNFIASIKIGL